MEDRSDIERSNIERFSNIPASLSRSPISQPPSPGTDMFSSQCSSPAVSDIEVTPLQGQTDSFMENVEASDPDKEEQFQNKYNGEAPRNNMVFTSLDKAYSFYLLYAKCNGFDMRIRTTKRFKKSEEIRYRLFTCSRQGKGKKKVTVEVGRRENTVTSRCGCPVTFAVKRKTLNGPWVSTGVRNAHNHNLTSPRSMRNLKNHKKMPSAACLLVERFGEIGIPTGKVTEVLHDEMGTFSKKDCWNHTRKVRRKILDSGDAASVFEYCRSRNSQDPNFYFSISHDEKQRMVNFFWVDSRARSLYGRFGDVVVFDTTYKTNKYELPFGLFVGVNNHCQSILFGCALLQDETEESYEWLFRTWLHAMLENAPISILTDQDKAIGNMVAKVFPSSAHRLCLWHIMKKFPEKYGSIYRERSAFKQDINRCLHQTWTTNDFDREWNAIMTSYGLQEDSWLQGLFEMRSSWVPIYNRHVFFAGMTTTQRCESMNALFDDFVGKGTTLREFIDKCEKAILSRYKSENEQHYKSKHKDPFSENLPISIAEHAAQVYTKAVLNEFLVEVTVCLKMRYKKKLYQDGCSYHYIVAENENSASKFTVAFRTSTLDASCDCCLFEFKGILCRHILHILNKKYVDKIPPQYILHRWTKDAADDIPVPRLVETNNAALTRNFEFNEDVNNLVPYLHESEESYQMIRGGMKKKLEDVKNLKRSRDENPNIEVTQLESSQVEAGQYEVPHLVLANPNVAKPKGRPRNSSQTSINGRLKGGLEIAVEASKKGKRKCGICKEEGHYRENCPNAKE